MICQKTLATLTAVPNIQGLIDVESEKDKMDIKSVLCSLQGLSDAFSKKKEEESQNSAPEKKVRMFWVDGWGWVVAANNLSAPRS